MLGLIRSGQVAVKSTAKKSTAPKPQARMKPPQNDCVVLSDSDDDCIISDDTTPSFPPDNLIVGPAIGLDTDIVVGPAIGLPGASPTKAAATTVGPVQPKGPGTRPILPKGKTILKLILEIL